MTDDAARVPLVVEIPEPDWPSLEESLNDASIEHESVVALRFDGVSAMVQVALALSPVAVPLLAKVVIELIRSRKHIAIKCRGVEVTGISEDNALEVLEKLMRPSGIVGSEGNDGEGSEGAN